MTTQEIKDLKGMSHQTIKGGKYAVFSHQDTMENLTITLHRIFLKWIPQSKENFDYNRPVFTEHFHAFDRDPSSFQSKIFIPLA